MPLRFATIIGARPQFVKAAAVSRIVAQTSGVDEEIIHTGQHFDNNMSESFFQELAIPSPTINLGINRGSHSDMTGRMLMALEKILRNLCPACVVVYGDTNSTLAGALAAAQLGIPVVHVEAGLRSGLQTQPEEINRVTTDHLSEVLFCPTRVAVGNLRKEGIIRGVFHVGDVMYDSARFAKSSATNSEMLERFDLHPNKYSLATVHRPENTDNGKQLASIFKYLKAKAKEGEIFMPLHPRTREAIERFGLDVGAIKTCNPVSYFEMAALISHAAAVLTDSGGIQKEAYFHRVPCITLRNQTEWTELIEAGWNRLWTKPEYKPRKTISDYGSGNASKKIVEKLREIYA